MSSETRRPPVNPVYYGSSEPLLAQVPVRAGPFTAVLEGADLRYIKLNGELVVLRLYAAVRDESWGTIAPVFTAYDLARQSDSFALTFEAEHVSQGEQGVDFAWRGRITGSADGTITCEMDGAARTPFKRNRIGWCILHPMSLAGQEVLIEGGQETTTSAFPVAISPHQPFFDIAAMQHGTPGGQAVRIDFTGDIFENEDQRNWTDASYKTYSTPLRIPYPVSLAAGDTVRQTVTLTPISIGPAAAENENGPVVTVRLDRGARLPALGLTTAGHGVQLSATERERFRRLGLAHLHHVVDLGRDDWRERLRTAADDAGAVETALQLEVLVGDDDSPRALLAEFASLAAPVARIAVFDHGQVTTADDLLRRARSARTEAGLDVPIGGGSRAYFTQLNRNVPSPELLDFVAYGLNPQVHAFDNASMVETLAAQAATVDSARRLVPNKPVVVGPITLKPRINPDAVPTTAAPLPGTLPATVDPRQASLFGAGWTVGSIRSLAEAGVDALTYYETTGWRGLIERADHALRVPAFPSRPGMAFPVYHVFADIGELPDPRLMPLDVSSPLAIDGLALRAKDLLRLIVASFRDTDQQVTVFLPGATEWRVRMLDETSYDTAADDPEQFRQRWSWMPSPEGALTLSLKPFAIATLDVTLAAV